jgi:transposase
LDGKQYSDNSINSSIKKIGGEVLVKFSKEVCRTIYELVSKGFPYKDICKVCDIDESTFYRWIDRGKKAKSGQYKTFVMELEKAKALRKHNLVDKLIEKTEAKDDWKGYAWLLERGYDDEFARPEVRIKQELEAKADVNVDLTRFERRLKKLDKDD